jgi:hypothetical protein
MVAAASPRRKIREDSSIGFEVTPAVCPAAVRLTSGDVAAAAAASAPRLRKPRREISGCCAKSVGIMRTVPVFGSRSPVRLVRLTAVDQEPIFILKCVHYKERVNVKGRESDPILADFLLLTGRITAGL